jgi:2-methylisocitrate lyase-like PEP mutase family enzyme
VLYAPGIVSKEDIAAVVKSVDRPVNVLAGMPGLTMNRSELAALGVKRISIGSGLSRVALSAFLRAASEMHDSGTFTFAHGTLMLSEIGSLFPE